VKTAYHSTQKKKKKKKTKKKKKKNTIRENSRRPEVQDTGNCVGFGIQELNML
jgi:hypothetical protein